jgi:hypothetical protein
MGRTRLEILDMGRTFHYELKRVELRSSRLGWKCNNKFYAVKM